MARNGYDYFVVLAGMRTGSNLLEEQLSAMQGLQSYGELFNPHFFGKPKQQSQFGLSLSARDSDPVQVIAAMCRDGGNFPGFRLFYDHDRRVIDHVLADPKAAKIILTRRPVDSYVSLKIARKTGQWWLGDMTSARAAKVAFDAAEYADFLNTLSEYQAHIRRALQTSGQSAFHIDYSELREPDVIAGLGQFLGVEGLTEKTNVAAKVQNPTPVVERLSNPDEAERLTTDLAAPYLGYIPSFEPERGPGLRMFHACATAPLLYMPIRGAGVDPIPEWLREIDPDGRVDNGMTQKDVRRWMRRHPGHRSFTVLRHPLPRAYDAFCRFVLPSDAKAYAELRHALVNRYNVPLPEDASSEDWSRDRQAEAFLAFLIFLAGNLGGQTSLRVDHAWASQETFLSAIARFAVPDRAIREHSLGDELKEIAAAVGLRHVSRPVGAFSTKIRFPLEAIRTDAIDAACEAAYRRDYVFFGFEAWRPPSQAA